MSTQALFTAAAPAARTRRAAMRPRLRVLAAGLAAALSFGLMASASAQTVMRINISIGKDSHQGVAIDEFAKVVNERSAGRYKVETFYAGSLGGERESIESVQLGTQALTLTSTGPVPNFVPDARILDIPFLFRAEDVHHALGQLAKLGEQRLVVRQLLLVRQMVVVQQVDDFLVGDVAGEFVDVVAAVNELADVAAHVAQTRVGRDHTFKTLGS